MNTLAEFKQSLSTKQPNNSLSIQLKSLWYDGKGDWQRAHTEVDQLSDRDSSWVHAYLHRKEGDTCNADFWYRKAGQTRPGLPIEKEWELLVLHFINQS